MKKSKATIDDLARMVKRGFDGVDKRFDTLEGDMRHVKGEITHMKGEIAHLNASVSTVQRDVAEIRKQFVRRDEFDDLFGRVTYLERRLGIKSGK